MKSVIEISKFADLIFSAKNIFKNFSCSAGTQKAAIKGMGTIQGICRKAAGMTLWVWRGGDHCEGRHIETNKARRPIDFYFPGSSERPNSTDKNLLRFAKRGFIGVK